MQTPARLASRLAFRLPPDVAEAWRERADRAGLSLSDFVRSAVDQAQATGIAAPAKRPAKRAYHPADPALLRQLAWLGNNTNQIARWVNSNKKGIEAAEILSHLKSIEENLKRLADHAD